MQLGNSSLFLTSISTKEMRRILSRNFWLETSGKLNVSLCHDVAIYDHIIYNKADVPSYRNG